jgi:uncharacterized membrane protein YphA (DoxX/SURF4 family)
MKKTKILYWTITGIFAAFMISTSVPDIVKQKEAVEFISNLGYPDYFIPFIGVAKILGCIAILVPGFPRLKEWAYAGLFFDLIGASFSLVSKFGFKVDMLFMAVCIAVLFASYFFYHKLQKELAAAGK